ncbi:nuclear transport factor 2 family protein [Fodinibius salsisoli]|uniref:Nuclear transport factor 2 family protein n=1 Tax=Fodinibius salsisoli TaxID=2820877 RepID=A0ABT3PM60_9BACT|nr:nuclear transport factor 2 family protein [Fodinibius salsisoli]MCW9707032.1 nuclear transport factor 2 family protein [Fodinibius salsisoli]
MSNYKNRWIVGVVALVLLGSCSAQPEVKPSKQKVSAILNGWHQAAAQANFDQYFSYFSGDSAIFMGTDATERWTITEFKEYAKPHFERGRAWNFTPVERHIYFSNDGATAWFDESLDTPNLGPARGTGTLVKQDTTWKIAHYNLSIPIPNAIADTVIKQVEEALKDTSSK